jgi:hypothetical protein
MATGRGATFAILAEAAARSAPIAAGRAVARIVGRGQRKRRPGPPAARGYRRRSRATRRASHGRFHGSTAGIGSK